MAHHLLKLCSLIFLCFLSVDARAQRRDNNLGSAIFREWEINDKGCRTPDREPGLCIDIYSCKAIIDILDTISESLPAEVTTILKGYQCGFTGRIPKVCCPFKPIHLETTKTSIHNSPSEPPNVSNHPNLKLLPQNCGVLDTGNRIINGKKTGLFEFPWMALLSYRTNYGPKFRCGATIINNRYILTAAHCLTNLKSPLIGVRVGDHNILTRQDCQRVETGEQICAPPYQDLQIEEIIPHPNFDRTVLNDDIGLIRLRTPMDFSRENIRPVCLPLEKARNYDFTNRNGIVTGWGTTEKGVESPELLKVAVPTVPQEQCSRIYVNVTKINNRQLCAGGNEGRDSCSGDSGGPLHVLARMNGDTRLIQQGVVSFGPVKCGKAGWPGIYTKVAYYMDWILDNIKP